MAEFQIHAEGDFNDDDARIEFFYLSGKCVGMECPIEACDGLRFASKTKYQRHWDERHTPMTVTYACPFMRCRTTCVRRTDLKTHFKTVHHESDEKELELLLSKSSKVVRENRRFVDPGFFVYKGRTKVIVSSESATTSSVESTPASTSPVSASVPCSTVACTTLSPVFSVKIPTKPPVFPSTKPPSKIPALMDLTVVPDITPSTLTSRISVEEYRARKEEQTSSHVVPCPVDTHPGCSSTVSQPSTSVYSSTTPSPMLDLRSVLNHRSSFTTSIPAASGSMTQTICSGLPLAFNSTSVSPGSMAQTFCSSLAPSSSSVTSLSGVMTQTPCSGLSTAFPRTFAQTSSLSLRFPSSSAHMETQTSCFDYSPLILPDIPEDRIELEKHLRWLCDCIDIIGRQREAAKERLEEMRRDGTRLEQEKEARRKLEVENRRLRKELKEMKWRESTFGTDQQ